MSWGPIRTIPIQKGRTKNYSLSVKDEEVIKLLVTYKESFLDKLVDSVIEMWENQ